MKIADIIRGFEDPEVEEAGAGPSRIVSHIQDGTPFIMISAFRGTNPHKVNVQRHAQMKHVLAKYPVSYIQTEGEYQEEGSDEPKPEQSLFIMPNRDDTTMPSKRLLAIGKALMAMFNQDSILYGDGEMVWLVFNDGSTDKLGNRLTFRPEVIDTLGGFSKVKHRKFSFTDPDTAAGAATYQAAA